MKYSANLAVLAGPPPQFIYRNQERFGKQYEQMILLLAERIAHDLRLFRSFTNTANGMGMKQRFIKKSFYSTQQWIYVDKQRKFAFNQYQSFSMKKLFQASYSRFATETIVRGCELCSCAFYGQQ